jgi:choline-glycine betaine transporter
MNTVMLVSLVLCAAIAIWGVADPDSMTGAAQWLVNYSLTALDWYFLALCTAFLVIMGFMAFSKYGNIKLGADDDEPEFSTGSWVAMLFAAGMGSGLLFWGVAEPIYHFMTPPVGEGETAMAARNAMVITNLHWGLHAWSIYGCCALVIAYFTFRLGSMVSTPILVGFKNVFGKSTLKQIGNTADILAVIAVIFGLAGSLAMGTLMVRSGMAAVFDTSQDVTMSMIIIAVMTVCFLLSACTGVDKGIKILSNINMIVAILILLVVLFGGPTAYLFQSFIYSRVLELVSRLDPDLPDLVAGLGSVRRHLHRAHQPRPHHPRIRHLRGRRAHHRFDAVVRRVWRRRDSYRNVRRRGYRRQGVRRRRGRAVRILRVLSGHHAAEFPGGLPDIHLPGHQRGLGHLRH